MTDKGDVKGTEPSVRSSLNAFEAQVGGSVLGVMGCMGCGKEGKGRSRYGLSRKQDQFTQRHDKTS